MKYIDLSHSIFDGLITYKGLPAPGICDYLSREASKSYYTEGTTFQIGRIDMIANTGTYIDTPFHRYENGRDLSEIRLEEIVSIEGIVIRAEGQTAIDANFFIDQDISGKAVLVHTGWSRHWNTDKYFEGHPYLTENAACYLKEHGTVIVGIDSHNIDNIEDKRRPVHSLLLRNDIYIVEHMTNLAELPDNGFLFSAVPPKVKGMGTWPVRAYGSVRT